MNNSDWLDIDVLEDYLDGKLDAKAMHRVELLSLEDPFIAEALAGLSLSPKRTQSLSLLQKQLQERVAQKPVEEKRWQLTSQRLSIAAAAAVLFVTVSLLFWMRESNNRDQLAAGKPKKVEASIAPVDARDTPVTAVPNAEMEKVIAGQPSPVPSPIAVPAIEADVPKIERMSEEVSLRSSGVQKENESLSRNVSSALAGKVAGVQVNDSSIKGTALDENNSEITGASAKLSEVVIAGYGTVKKTALTGSALLFQPLDGWDKFEAYVLNNNRLLIDKKLTGSQVILRFKLNTNGEPTDIKVFTKVNVIAQNADAVEKEAIRLLKDGPKWVNNSALTELSVNIKF